MVVRYVYLPEPLPHQAEMLDDPHRFKVNAWGRQAGKTAACSIAATYGHGPTITEHDDAGNVVYVGPKFRGALLGAQIWWVTKDYPTSLKIWRDLKTYLRRWGGELSKTEVEKRIEFPGGGSITIKSAHDPDSLRGETLDGLILDEAAFCHEDTWSLALRPTLLRRQGWAIIVSTPKGLNWFYEEWLIGSEFRDPDYRSWHLPSSVNPTLSREELEKAKAKVGPYAYAREYLAEFNVKGGNIFERKYFRFYLDQGGVLQGLGEDGKPAGEPAHKASMVAFATADLAMTVKTNSDFTVCMIWSRSPDGRLWCRDLWRGKLEAPQVVPMLKRMYDAWQCRGLWVEASGPLVRLNAEARECGMTVHEVAIHSGSMSEKKDKVSRNEPAAPAVEGGRILFPGGVSWLNEFISECCAFPDASVNDDQVDCLGLAVIASPPLAQAAPLSVPRRTMLPPQDGGAYWTGARRGRKW